MCAGLCDSPENLASSGIVNFIVFNTVVFVSFSSLGQIPDIHNLMEDKFIVAHVFRGFSLWLTGSKTETS